MDTDHLKEGLARKIPSSAGGIGTAAGAKGAASISPII
jgi:hypothetical protein